MLHNILQALAEPMTLAELSSLLNQPEHLIREIVVELVNAGQVVADEPRHILRGGSCISEMAYCRSIRETILTMPETVPCEMIGAPVDAERPPCPRCGEGYPHRAGTMGSTNVQRYRCRASSCRQLYADYTQQWRQPNQNQQRGRRV